MEQRHDKHRNKNVPCFEKQKNSEYFKTIITSINKIALPKHREYLSELQ